MITTRIAYDAGSYTCFVTIDGTEHAVGSAPTQGQGDVLCNEYLIAYFTDAHTPEKAAALVMANAYAGYGVAR